MRSAVLAVMVVVSLSCSSAASVSPDAADPVGQAVERCVGEVGVTVGAFVGDDGIEREYRVFVPPLAGDAALPLVLNFHGLGSNGGEQASYSGYEDLAVSEGFVVAHPTGTIAIGGVNSWELAQFDLDDRDDVDFVRSFIEFLGDEFCIDTDRVYSTGMSNGGLFSAHLVCRLADRIAAAVSVAGVTHSDDCDPSRPVPYMAIHGTADNVVSFDGTGPTLLGPGDPPVGSFFAQIMPDEFAEFAFGSGCDPVPEVSTLGDDVIEHRYLQCREDVSLVFLEVSGGGHVWPGSPFAEELSTDASFYTTAIDATTDGWNFMKQFALPPD